MVLIKPLDVCVQSIAAILRGKNKAYYTPHVDCGDFVIVINCDKVKFTGNKMEDKIYDNYTGYPGGRKEEVAKDLLKAQTGSYHRKSDQRYVA